MSHTAATAKYAAELTFWTERFVAEGHAFRNAHYKRYMLALAEEDNDLFLRDKVVADFGCGPRGSLQWVGTTHMKFGIDVLADAYFQCFTAELLKHDMVYLKNTEQHVPMPSGFVDVLFSLNALDHVDNFSIFADLVRVLKPGGLFCCSFNLNEPASVCEPQSFSLEFIQRHVVPHFEVLSIKIADKDPKGAYNFLMRNEQHSYDPGKEQILWFKGVKPLSFQKK